MKNFLNKIRKLIYKIPTDKLLHGYLGDITLPIFIVIISLIGHLNVYGVILIASVLNGILIGGLKEEFDKATTNKYDINDALATCVGSIIGGLRLMLILYVLELFKFIQIIN